MNSNKRENWKKFFNDKISKEIPKNDAKNTLRFNLYRLENIQNILLIEKNFFAYLQKDKDNLYSTLLNQIKTIRR